MKDDVVIARQARRIEELTAELEESKRAEQQLMAILDSAGIKVKQVELSEREARFLALYRRATADGKATIRAKAKAIAAEHPAPCAKVKETEITSTVSVKKREATTAKLARADSEKGMAKVFSDLPMGFFKPAPNETT